MYIADKVRSKVRLCTEIPKSSVFEDLFARIKHIEGECAGYFYVSLTESGSFGKRGPQ